MLYRFHPMLHFHIPEQRMLGSLGQRYDLPGGQRHSLFHRPQFPRFYRTIARSKHTDPLPIPRTTVQQHHIRGTRFTTFPTRVVFFSHEHLLYTNFQR